jgi:hypothetical protein
MSGTFRNWPARLSLAHLGSVRTFLRLLGFVYFIAFNSFGMQALGLIGSHGISPYGDYLIVAGNPGLSLLHCHGPDSPAIRGRAPSADLRRAEPVSVPERC